MNDALRTSAAHVFVEDLGHPELEDDDAHHLLKVLRIRESDVISVSDGRGSWGTATVSRDGVVTMLEGPNFVPSSPIRLGVAFVPVKGERPELVVQKLTEIGIDDVYPLAPTTRSVVKWDGEKADKHHARLVKVSRDGVVTMLEGPNFVPSSPIRLGVAFVPVKGERPELVVQKLTEIGIDDVYPLAPTTRSVVKWDGEKADKHHARLVKVSREASMQSRRVWLPAVHEIRTLDSVLALDGCVVADPDGRSLSSADRLLVIGPEGGFSRDEIASATTVSLGESILRAETAAIVAGTLMVNMARG